MLGRPKHAGAYAGACAWQHSQPCQKQRCLVKRTAWRRRAHPLGARPFARADYVRKFRMLAESVLEPTEIERFLALAQRLPELTPAEVRELSIVAAPGVLASAPAPKGLF